MRSRALVLILSFCAISPSRGQSGEDTPVDDKPKDAYIKIINACDTTQPERWRTGLDLKFKGKPIGRDIRLGERGPIGKISFTGKDVIEVFRQGDDTQALASVPALLKGGGFYTLVIMGQIGASSADLKVAVVEEYPLPPSSERPGLCRVDLLNAVQAYPVSLSIGKDPPQPLTFGERKEIFLPPGEIDLGLWFTDSKGVRQRLQAGMVAQAGGNITAVVHPSEERADRPGFFRADAMDDRAAVAEMNAKPEMSPTPN